MSWITKRVITDLAGTSPYLVRWSIWLPFGWSIKIHKIMRPDSDRCAHCHPWPMLRIILNGGYVEEYGPYGKVAHRKPWRPWAPWRIYWCGAKFRHRITELPDKVSWTLALMGGKEREWGFYTKAGFVPWRKFVDETRATRVMWCDDRPEQKLEDK